MNILKFLVVSMAILGLPCLTYEAAAQMPYRLVFEHYVGDRPLVLDDAHYTNASGQDYTVTKLKYYISNIVLHSVAGKVVPVGGYYIVNEEEPASKIIALENVPAGDYKAIGFTVGVDSLHNCSGAQSGALDPVNAMYWTWNTGYIFLKLEGKSPASKSPGHLFEFHIGGYKAPANCIRDVRLEISLNAGGELHIKADVAGLLSLPNRIDFSQLSSVTDSHKAPMLADNYALMFSVLNGLGK